jgi:hypothetical protein
VPPTDANLAKDLGTRGCPVCDHLRPITFGFFAHWQYALASDEQAQAQFAAEGGFCAFHAWELEAISSPVGSSVGYPRLVERIARVLAQAAQSPDAERAVRQLLRQRHTCRACRLLRDAERRYTECLAAFLHAPHNRDTYAQSQGVCLRHLALLLAMWNRDEVVPFLLSHAARRFEELAEDMQAFALKTHALRRTLHNDDETDAYWRAITHIVGAKSVSLAEQAEILLGG